MKASKKATGKQGSKKKASKKPAKRIIKLSVNERPTPTERTSEEVAELIGITVSGVRQQYLRGNIAGRIVGRGLWIQLAEAKRYKRERLRPGRPFDTISGESHNKRGASETEYQRDYKRKLRAGLIKPGRGAKRTSAKQSKKAKTSR